MGETQPGDLSFDKALTCLLAGVRMAARFMPDSIYIELQKPDANSMNTEPYLKMVMVDQDPKPTSEGGTLPPPRIVKCEPWEPGRRSIFSDEWYTSKYQGAAL